MRRPVPFWLAVVCGCAVPIGRGIGYLLHTFTTRTS